MRAIFWLLNDQQTIPPSFASEYNALWRYMACVLTSDLYRQNKRVLLLAENQDSAQEIDELIWQFNAQRFVPHNLPGEGPHYGTPVEINWEPSIQRRPCVVNCALQVPESLRGFKGLQEWHDFVPSDDVGKKAARERYKALRALGAQVSTSDIPSILE